MSKTFLIIGLGNPGEEYTHTRHNIGRSAVEVFAKDVDADEWSSDSKGKSLVTSGIFGKQRAWMVLPETFMNKSGYAAAYFVKTKKVKPENVVIVYDDIDLPHGTVKLSFSRGSGGHRGLESVIKTLKTRDFVRVRIGVSPTTPSGKLRKPTGEEKVVRFLLSPMKDADKKSYKKIFKTINEGLTLLIEEGRERAMNTINSR